MGEECKRKRGREDGKKRKGGGKEEEVMVLVLDVRVCGWRRVGLTGMWQRAVRLTVPLAGESI